MNSSHKGQWRGVFFDLRLNKRLSKQSRCWWFETASCSLWCHCNKYPFYLQVPKLDRNEISALILFKSHCIWHSFPIVASLSDQTVNYSKFVNKDLFYSVKYKGSCPVESVRADHCGVTISSNAIQDTLIYRQLARELTLVDNLILGHQSLSYERLSG